MDGLHRRRADGEGVRERARGGGIRGRRDPRDPPSARQRRFGDHPRHDAGALVSTAQKVNLKDPQALYLDWEHAHWAAQDVDLSRDPADWAGIEDSERDL